VCWKCQGELLDWRHCTINGERNGIIHLPTWTLFRIEAEEAVFLRTAEIDGASGERIEELRTVASEAFRTLRARWEPRPCTHPHL